MKRVALGVMGGVLAMFLSACGENAPKQPEAPTTPTEQTAPAAPAEQAQPAAAPESQGSTSGEAAQ